MISKIGNTSDSSEWVAQELCILVTQLCIVLWYMLFCVTTDALTLVQVALHQISDLKYCSAIVRYAHLFDDS